MSADSLERGPDELVAIAADVIHEGVQGRIEADVAVASSRARWETAGDRPRDRAVIREPQREEDRVPLQRRETRRPAPERKARPEEEGVRRRRIPEVQDVRVVVVAE